MRLSRLFPPAVRARAAAIAVALVPSLLAAQSPPPSRPPSAPEFAEQFAPIAEVAAYLALYDMIAWVSSDSVVALARRDSAVAAKVGREWFAFRGDSGWHAVYGRYDAAADSYVQAAHYVPLRDGPAVRRAPPVDSLLARRYGRALHATRARLPSAAHTSGAMFNAYTRSYPDGSLDVWYLPAWQQNGWLLYGREFWFRVNASGAVVDSSSVVAQLRGGTPDPTLTISIDSRDRELPTVGEAFFAYYYGKHFGRVFIHNRHFTSSYARAGDRSMWFHAARPAADSASGRGGTR